MRKTVRSARTTYAVLAPYGRPHRRHLLEGALATLVLVAGRLAIPWPMHGLIEVTAGSGAAVVGFVPHVGDPVLWLVGGFVAVILLWGISESRQRLAFTRFAVGIVQDTRAVAIAHAPAAECRPEPGDPIATATGDLARVTNGVKTILIGTFRNAVFFTGATIIVSLIDPLIGLIFFAGGIAALLVGAFGGITTFVADAVRAASTCAILVLTIHAGRSGRLSAGSVFTILVYLLLMHNNTIGFGRRIVRGDRLLPSAARLATLVAVSELESANTLGPAGRRPTAVAPPEWLGTR
jgi:ABC-type multidrug transport system fused ATPase/permease subunit